MPKKLTPARQRQLVREFLKGRSFVGCARKFGCTSLEAQDMVRRRTRRRRV